MKDFKIDNESYQFETICKFILIFFFFFFFGFLILLIFPYFCCCIFIFCFHKFQFFFFFLLMILDYYENEMIKSFSFNHGFNDIELMENSRILLQNPVAAILKQKQMQVLKFNFRKKNDQMFGEGLVKDFLPKGVQDPLSQAKFYKMVENLKELFKKHRDDTTKKNGMDFNIQKLLEHVEKRKKEFKKKEEEQDNNHLKIEQVIRYWKENQTIQKEDLEWIFQNYRWKNLVLTLFIQLSSLLFFHFFSLYFF
jgi:hypothetical protein